MRAVLVAALASALLLGCQRSIDLGRANVVLIVIDTLRADHLGAWGYPHDTSPNLDRLAQEGAQFAGTFSNSSWTRPSMASLLTGWHPRTTGIAEERFDRLPEDLTTLAEVFSAAGYLTLGLTANPNINAFFGFGQGFREWTDSGWRFGWMDDGNEAAGRARAEDASEVTDRALELLDRHASATGDPFYLQLLYMDPHFPNHPPAEHRLAVGSATDRYDGSIRHADAEIGRLLRELRGRGLLEDTLVVVTADHGEGLGSHRGVPNSKTHGHTLYDSVAHVPLIFWHPKLAPARVEALTQLLDVVPTLAELLELPVDDALPGSSLVPFFSDPGRPADAEFVVSETDWRFVRKLSLRSSTHRYVRNDAARRYRDDGTFEGRRLRGIDRRHFAMVPDEELYRRPVGADAPFEHPERTDAHRSEPDTVATLRSAALAWEAAVPPRAPENRSSEDVVTRGDGSVVPSAEAGGARAPDADLEAQLEALGYLDD